MILLFLVRGSIKINSTNDTVSSRIFSDSPCLDSRCLDSHCLDMDSVIIHSYYIYFNSIDDDKYIEVEDVNDTIVIRSNCIISIKHLDDKNIEIITNFTHDWENSWNYEKN